MTDATATLSMLSSEVKRHNHWFLFVGITLALLGIAAILFPLVSAFAVEILIGWILLINGALAMAHAWGAARWRGVGVSLLSGLVSIAAGIVLLLYPWTGMLSLTLMIAAFLIAEGVLRSVLSFRLRPLDYWSLLLASGLLSIALGLVLLVQSPVAAAWLIGILIGVDLLAAGLVAIVLAVSARRDATVTSPG
jgi:uncharacterized membrane protein HdeD (DUF308 family)